VRRRRFRGGFNTKDNNSATRKGGFTSDMLKGLLWQATGFIINDLRKPNSKIKGLISKIIPKVKYDDTKEIKNAKYTVLEDKQKEIKKEVT
jgi:hypothetical protein